MKQGQLFSRLCCSVKSGSWPGAPRLLSISPPALRGLRRLCEIAGRYHIDRQNTLVSTSHVVTPRIFFSSSDSVSLVTGLSSYNLITAFQVRVRHISTLFLLTATLAACAREQPQPQVGETLRQEVRPERERLQRQSNVPTTAIEVYNHVIRTGSAPRGYVGGRVWENRERRLPLGGKYHSMM